VASVFAADEISVASPTITDKWAQRYGENRAEFRYAAVQTLTVHSGKIVQARAVCPGCPNWSGKESCSAGRITRPGRSIFFTRLNDVKPAMIEETTRRARGGAEVRGRFAEHAGQDPARLAGQFSILDRDQNNPHIKKVRVVSTVEYYLLD
jgi:hypothetical protein